MQAIGDCAASRPGARSARPPPAGWLCWAQVRRVSFAPASSRRVGYSVTVYDSRREPGGLVRYAIAPYRQLNDPLRAEAQMLTELGVELRLGVPIDSRACAAPARGGGGRDRARRRHGPRH